MAKSIYEFETSHGKVFIEAEPGSDALSGKIPANNRGNKKFAEAQTTLEAALSNVERFYKALSDVAHKIGPSEIGVEIGVKFNVEAGVFIISAGSEVDFKLQLKWSKS